MYLLFYAQREEFCIRVQANMYASHTLCMHGMYCCPAELCTHSKYFDVAYLGFRVSVSAALGQWCVILSLCLCDLSQVLPPASLTLRLEDRFISGSS